MNVSSQFWWYSKQVMIFPNSLQSISSEWFNIADRSWKIKLDVGRAELALAKLQCWREVDSDQQIPLPGPPIISLSGVVDPAALTLSHTAHVLGTHSSHMAHACTRHPLVTHGTRGYSAPTLHTRHTRVLCFHSSHTAHAYTRHPLVTHGTLVYSAPTRHTRHSRILGTHSSHTAHAYNRHPLSLVTIVFRKLPTQLC